MRKGHGAGPGPDSERSGLSSGRALPAAAGPTRGTAPRARPRPPRAAGRARLGAERRLQLPAGPAAQGGRGGLSLSPRPSVARAAVTGRCRCRDVTAGGTDGGRTDRRGRARRGGPGRGALPGARRGGGSSRSPE